jgi:hypothetical protein
MLLESIGTPDPAPGCSQERDAYEKAAATGNPLDLFMLTGPRRRAHRPARPSPPRAASTTRALVASLLDSREIYALQRARDSRAISRGQR